MTQRVVDHLKTKALHKHFGAVSIFKDVILAVKDASILAIAGPNGGGKTTLLRCLVGLLEADNPAGLAWPALGAASPLERRRKIGYVPDDCDLIPHLSAEEYFAFVAACYRRDPQATVQAALDVLQALDFDQKWAKRAIGSYSHGMQKKVQLAAVLAVRPPLLIIDEPTNGLDPSAILLLRGLLMEYAQAGRAVVIASHHLAFVEHLTDEVLVLNHEVLAQGSVNALLRKYGCGSLESLYERLVLYG